MVKGKFAQPSKAFKFYEHYCLENVPLLFMCLLTALIVKNGQSLAGIYFIFFKKNILDQTWKAFNTKFGPQWKNRESSYQVRQVLVLFCKLAALILGENCGKALDLQKLSNKLNLKGSGAS